MKCLILVGGYAMRMRPVTLKSPKALLELGKSTVLDCIMDNIQLSTTEIDEYILVTNDTFYDDFVTWKKEKAYQEKVTVISDGSTCEEKKVGAVSALVKTILDLNIDEDIFVLAGDNILDFSLKYIFDDFRNTSYSYIMYYEEPRKERLQRTGVLELDEEGFIKAMEEKPEEPKSNYAVPPFYWLKKSDVNLLLKLFKDKQKIDSMGQIILNLCEYTKISTKLMEGRRYDVGSKDDYYNISKYVMNEKKKPIMEECYEYSGGN